mmetsp:Transcript_108373/g.337738  ORF Transcript_108373/g.337738 Transcript_108373/m.337738 type:complete len:269 (+) Transcript_108373:48-854(+)
MRQKKELRLSPDNVMLGAQAGQTSPCALGGDPPPYQSRWFPGAAHAEGQHATSPNGPARDEPTRRPQRAPQAATQDPYFEDAPRWPQRRPAATTAATTRTDHFFEEFSNLALSSAGRAATAPPPGARQSLAQALSMSDLPDATVLGMSTDGPGSRPADSAQPGGLGAIGAAVFTEGALLPMDPHPLMDISEGTACTTGDLPPFQSDLLLMARRQVQFERFGISRGGIPHPLRPPPGLEPSEGAISPESAQHCRPGMSQGSASAPSQVP